MKSSFSVLMSVYKKESPLYLKKAIDSVLGQTLMPSEIVLIKDGPLTEKLDEIINSYENQFPNLFNIVSLKQNQGLGKALKLGVLKCSNPIVARMDTDDICFEKRFEKQIDFLQKHPKIDIVGSWIKEFEGDCKNITSVRKVPEVDEKIKKFHKKRNALNHMTVVFRKDKVVEAGNYQDMPFFEDYYLWSRMMLKGMMFYNFQEALIYARVDNDMIGRRHGWHYAKHEFFFFKRLKRINFFSLNNFIFAVVFRIPLRLLPKKILSIIYNKGTRSK